MNKKGIIVLVVVVALVVVGFVVFGNSSPSPVMNTGGTSTTTTTTTTTTTPIPAGVTKNDYMPVNKDTTDTSLISRLNKSSVGISEDGKKIGFVNGMATFTAEGSTVQSSAKIGDVAIAKAKGSRNDVLSTVSVTTSGASATYLVLFADNGSAGLEDKAFAIVGTNVTVTGIRTDSVADSNIDYIVSVSYTDGSKAAHTKIFVVTGGTFDLGRTINL